jgi:hypothetical protein
MSSPLPTPTPRAPPAPIVLSSPSVLADVTLSTLGHRTIIHKDSICYRNIAIEQIINNTRAFQK